MVMLLAKRKPKTTTFGSRLKELRTTAGLTQKALADAVGLKQPQIAALETPTANPTIDTLQKLAAALNVSPADLLPPPSAP